MSVNHEAIPEGEKTYEFDLDDSTIRLIGPDSVFWEDAIKFETAIFKDRDYIDNDDDLIVEYKDYLPQTRMMISFDGSPENHKISACARLIEYSPEIGFRTLNDATGELPEGHGLTISEEGWQLVEKIGKHNMIEVATISGVGDAGAELYGAFGRLGLDTDPYRRWLLASLSNGAYHGAIKPLFGDAVSELGPTVDYYGTPTTPLIVDLEKGWENIKSLAELTKGDDYYERIFERIVRAKGSAFE